MSSDEDNQLCSGFQSKQEGAGETGKALGRQGRLE